MAHLKDFLKLTLANHAYFLGGRDRFKLQNKKENLPQLQRCQLQASLSPPYQSRNSSEALGSGGLGRNDQKMPSFEQK